MSNALMRKSRTWVACAQEKEILDNGATVTRPLKEGSRKWGHSQRWTIYHGCKDHLSPEGSRPELMPPTSSLHQPCDLKSTLKQHREDCWTLNIRDSIFHVHTLSRSRKTTCGCYDHFLLSGRHRLFFAAWSRAGPTSLHHNISDDDATAKDLAHGGPNGEET
jgi:hypothetical protein